MDLNRTYYDILDLPKYGINDYGQKVSLESIRRARDLLIYGRNGEDKAPYWRVGEIETAYRTLSDPYLRAQYDAELEKQKDNFSFDSGSSDINSLLNNDIGEEPVEEIVDEQEETQEQIDEEQEETKEEIDEEQEKEKEDELVEELEEGKEEKFGPEKPEIPLSYTPISISQKEKQSLNPKFKKVLKGVGIGAGVLALGIFTPPNYFNSRDTYIFS